MRTILNVATAPSGAMSRIAHTIERLGLAMAGAICGFYVAANLIRGNAAVVDPTGFVAVMALIGMLGFYLRIDRPVAGVGDLRSDGRGLGINPIEWLSASGTFLTAMAALVSVGAIVFDEAPQSAQTVFVATGWLLGVGMQIGAGAIARRRADGG